MSTPAVSSAPMLRRLLESRGVSVDVYKSGLVLDRRLVYNPRTNRCVAKAGERELKRVRCYLLGATDRTRADLLARLLGK